MKKYLFGFILLFLGFYQISFAQTSQFVFVTEPQTIKPNTISKSITIQSQNSSGISQPVSNTFDLVFISSSASGEFLNSSGNSVSTTMSTNTANRTFYYRDSAEGNFIITVTATNRVTQESFTASQNVVVSNLVVEDEEEEEDKGQNNQNGSSGSANNNSAHSSPAPLNTSKTSVSFEVSAGRDRLTMVGNKILFRATPLKFSGIDPSNIFYTWSFGDGSVGTGVNPAHFYEFPGEYIVVLNANFSDHEAVSRIKVKVVEPEVSIEKVSGGIKVSNKSGIEVNLEGWLLKSGLSQFIFPKDTLIQNNGEITFPDRVTGIYSEEIELHNPMGKLVIKNNNLSIDSDKSRAESYLEEIEKQINILQVAVNQLNSQYAVITPSQVSFESSYSAPVLENINLALVDKSESDISDSIFEVDDGILSEDENFLTANSADIFILPKTESSISYILSWPVRGFSFIKNLFR